MATLVCAPGYKPVHVKKVGRNELCPFGSGLKAKRCNCGKLKQYYFLRSEQPERAQSNKLQMPKQQAYDTQQNL